MSTLPSTRQITLAGCAVCALLTAAAWFAIVAPISAARLDASELDEAIARQEQENRELARRCQIVRQALESFRTKLDESEVALQSLQHVNTRVANLGALVEESGMMIEGTVVGNAEPGPHYQAVPIRISGTGNFPRCASFLHVLHETMPDTGLGGLELSGNPRDPAAPARFQLDLVWYAAPALANAPE